MDCPRCKTLNEERAQYCKNCGMKLSLPGFAATAAVTDAEATDKKDLYWVLGYMGWYFFYSVLYMIIFKYLVKVFYSIHDVYKSIQLVISSIDALFMVLLIVVLKNKTGKACFGVFLLIRIAILVMYQL
jgi:hypothetical protein